MNVSLISLSEMKKISGSVWSQWGKCESYLSRRSLCRTHFSSWQRSSRWRTLTWAELCIQCTIQWAVEEDLGNSSSLSCLRTVRWQVRTHITFKDVWALWQQVGPKASRVTKFPLRVSIGYSSMNKGNDTRRLLAIQQRMTASKRPNNS